MAELPSGTVTFLLTDVEGSTTRWEHHPETMRVALARHDALLRAVIAEHGGHVVKTMGDAFHAVFRDASDAVAATVEAQRRLTAEAWDEIGGLRVRMALHTGVAEVRDGDYYGTAMNRVARLASIGHGGQVLLSETTAALVREGLPTHASLVDLGQHRLKDLTLPEHVFQVIAPDLGSQFPALSSLDARPHNLLSHPTALLGRERELAEVCGLFHGGARLVTLTGPGGTGKTRLGLQVGAELLDGFEHGVFFVDLAPIADPALVGSTMAQALGVRDVGSRPIVDALKEHLRARSVLLLLDNFEQILPAAPVVADLLAACPGVAVLATSREPLRLRGEHEYAVPPLALPEPRQVATAEVASNAPAVALFVQRAQAIRADFALTDENAPAVADICARVDGLPLAIELAAARVRLLTPQAMAARLERRLPLLMGGARDLPARQQTLRGAIDWSYDLLDSEEQALCRRLGVFVGGWTLDAAEAVCNLDDLDVLGGLESLVSKSLVRQDADARGKPRFGMLETIREYALEQLEASGEAPALRRRHAKHFVLLAEDAERLQPISQSEEGMNRLDAEHDNLRAALAWSVSEEGSHEIGVRIASALARHWQVRSHITEGLRWYDALLTPEVEAPPAARAGALSGAGWLAFYQGDGGRASVLFGEAARVARGIADQSIGRRRLSNAVGSLGVVREAQGNYEEAERLLQESLEIYRELGDTSGVASSLHNLGNVACAQGDFERARSLLEQSLALRRRDERSPFDTATVLDGLGLVALYQQDHERALLLFNEALTIFGELGHTYGIAWSYHYLGRVELLRGDAARAAAHLTEGLAMRRQFMDLSGIAQSLEGVAVLAVSRNDGARSARLFGTAASLRQTIHVPLSPAEKVAHERDLASARELLDEVTFASAWAEGRAMTLEQAVAYALDEQPSA